MSVFTVDKEKISIEGHQMAFYRGGSGTPLLLVHGITTYSFIWRRIIPLLHDHYDVIALDLLGCGDSDMPLDESYSIKEHARRLCLFADTLGLQRFHLVGHDLGGGIAQIFAVNHPERLLTLSLLNSVAHNFWPVQPISALRVPIVREILMSAVDMGAMRIVVSRGLYHQERLTDELLALFLHPLTSQQGRKAFKHFARCLNADNLVEIAPLLATLATPTLILRGDADPFLSVNIRRFLADTIPGCEVHTIATASHFIMEDEPEWIAHKLLAFLESHGAGRGA